MSRQDDKTEVRTFSIAVAIIALLIMAIAIFGCSPRIITNTVVQHDTTAIVKIDSLWQYQRDSVFVKEKGDTVYKYVEHIRYRDRVKIDTHLVVRVDSVAVERETIKEVEKPLSRWKTAKLGAFWWLIGALAVSLGWIFRKTLLKLIGM